MLTAAGARPPVRPARAAQLLRLGRDAARGGAFLAGLGLYLRRPLGLPEARAILADRLAHRADDFLELARRAIYGAPDSVYRKLLEHAGCGYPDLEQLVRREGLEGALRELFRQGVYLTVAELRGRAPVRRGSLSLQVDLERVRSEALFVRPTRQTGEPGAGAVGGCSTRRCSPTWW